MSGAASNRTQYHDPYANLAAAILDSGARCNDTTFLESDWADTLRTICSLDDEIYGNRTVQSDRAKIYRSSSHLGGDDG